MAVRTIVASGVRRLLIVWLGAALVVGLAAQLLASCGQSTEEVSSSQWAVVAHVSGPISGFPGLEAVDSFAFSNARLGWALDADTPGMLTTADGGRSWTMSKGRILGAPTSGVGALPSTIDDLPVPAQVLAFGRTVYVSCYAQTTGSAVNTPDYVRSYVLKSVDGGKTWRPCLFLPSRKYSVVELTASDALRLWAVCATGKPLWNTPSASSYLLRSEDGGRTWTRLENADAEALTFVDALHGWSLGRFCNGDWPTAVFRTSADGGETWRQVDQPEESGCFYALDAMHAWVGVSLYPASPRKYGLYSTADGGKTWTASASLAGVPVAGIFFADLDHGWVVAQRPGENGGATSRDPGGATIYATQNGGQDWTEELQATGLRWNTGEPWSFSRGGDTLFVSNGDVMASRRLVSSSSSP